MAMIEYKTYTLKSPQFVDDQGAVTARFATMEVLDKDDDWTERGAFGEQQVRISAYGHGSWRGALPVGKGRIYERGTEAIFEGKFFLSTETGREHYHTVKEMGDLQEWSYALPQIDFEFRQQDGRQIRVLKRIIVPEVSPVLLGAGVGTATLDIKSAERKQEGFQVQTVIFPKDAWDSAAACRAWLRDHDFSAGNLDETEQSYRFRQRDPGDFVRLRTICLVPGRDTPMDECRVQAVGGPVKESRGYISLDTDVADMLGWAEQLAGRFEQVQQIRAGKGKRLTAERLEQLEQLIVRLSHLKTAAAGDAVDPGVIADLVGRHEARRFAFRTA
jgi:hypothetical protein